MRSTMCTLVVVTVAALLMAARPVTAVFSKPELLSQLEFVAADRHTKHHAAQLRRFGVADVDTSAAATTTAAPATTTGAPQETSGPVSGDGGGQSQDAPPQCLQGTPFAVAFGYVSGVCSRDFGRLNHVDTKNETATKAGYVAFCTSTCLSALNQLMSDDEFRDCLTPDMSSLLEPMLGFCKKDSKGNYCVLQFAEIANRPEPARDSCQDQTSKTACAATTGCTWDANEKACEKTLTQAALAEVCNECILTLAESSDALAGLALGCKQVDGHYCAIELQSFTLDNPDAATLTRFCSNSYALPCVTQMVSGVSQLNIVKAQNTFVACLSSVSGTAKTCTATYLKSVAEYQKLVAQIPTMCRQNAASRFCYEGAMSATLDNTCFLGVLSTGTCDGSCPTEVQNISNTLGCCLGLYDQLFTPVAYTLSQVPGNFITADDLPAAAPLVKLDVTVTVSQVSNCAGYSAPVPLTNRCEGSTVSASVEQKLSLKLNWTHINGDELVKREVLRSLKEDVAALVGAHPSALVDASIAENKAILLNKKNDTGLSFLFKFKAATSALQAGFLKVFTAANNEGDIKLLVLQNTLSIVCTKWCLGPQGIAKAVVPVNPTALTLGTDVKPDPCYNREFLGQTSAVLIACINDPDPFATPFSSLETSNATFTTTCAAKCATGLRNLAQTKYAFCLPAELVLISNYVAVACSMDSVSKILCGAVMHKLDAVDCSSKTKAADCTGECSWNANKSRCDSRPSVAYLASVCEGECIPLYTASMAGDSGPMGTEARFIDEAVCAKDNETYCIPAIVDELNDEEFTIATVSTLCGNGTKGRCFRRFQTASSGLIIKAAEETFFYCAEIQQYDEAKVVSQCLPTYYENLVSSQKFDDLVMDMCLQKTNSDALCLSYFDKYADNTCFSNAFKDGTCGSGCASVISAAFDDMGCCAGTLQEIFGTPIKDLGLLPDFSGDDDGSQQQDVELTTTTAAPLGTIPPGFINTTSEIEVNLTQGFMTAAYKCVGDDTYKFVRRACRKDREGDNAVKELNMGIAFDAIKNDKKKKERIEQAARADLANKLGVSKDDIRDLEFVEDPSVKFEANTASRGFAMQQSANKSSATKLKFKVHAQKQNDTKAASATFDKAKADGKLTLPATTGTVSKECKTCVAKGSSASSVQGSAPATSLAKQNNVTKSGTKLVATTLGSMIATALAVLLLL